MTVVPVWMVWLEGLKVTAVPVLGGDGVCGEAAMTAVLMAAVRWAGVCE